MMDSHSRITIDPLVHHGNPVTRVPVERVVASLAAGMSSEQVECDYGITADDIKAALEFDAANWDKQIEADAKAGRLDKVADETLGDLRQGRCHDL